MKYHCQILLTTAALGTIACQKDVEPLAAPHTSSRTISFTPHASRPDEAILAEIQAEVPSFGGHFVGPNGNLTAYVTDLKDAPAASAALQRRLGTRIHLPRGVSSSIHVIKGDYTFQQLSDWRDSVFAHVLGKVHGVIYDDLDEGANRVAIAIEAGQESQVEPSVIQILTPLGVPTNAVAFVSKHRMRLATEMRPSSERASRATNTTPQTLGSWSDSLVGGLRVSCMHYSGGQTTFVGGGTVGYTASFSNGTHGFLTVSHCSPTQFQTDGTAGTYYQPYTISNSYVGYEAFDPSPGNCPLTWGCTYYRFSDANLVVDTSTTRHWAPGLIARPLGRYQDQAGDTTWDSVKPFLFVVGTQTDIVQYQSAEKIGATTGWTYGQVSRTCIDANDNPTFWVRCAYETSDYGNAGDSGGPVFTWDGADGVVAMGITFGVTDNNTDLYFSKWSNIQSELLGTGSFTSSIDIQSNISMSGTPALSGSVLGGAALSWSGVTVSNSPNPTIYTVYRSMWNASNYTWLDNAHGVSSSSSTGFTDNPSINIYSVTSAQPDACTYSYVQYTVVAYNSGRSATSNSVYFVGDADGPNPGQINCQ